jgi:hypothetical protein
MEFLGIIAIFISLLSMLVAFFHVYKWIVGERTHIVDYQRILPATKTIRMSPKSYIVSSPEKGVGFSTSMWIHIRDWTYKYGQPKVIYQKGGIRVYIDGETNDLKVDIPVFNPGKTTLVETITCSDVPLQKWVHVLLILDTRSVDIWIHGKLYISKHLSNVPKVDNEADLVLFPEGGYDGYFTRMIHFRYPISRLNIYALFWVGPVDLTLLGTILYWVERLFMPVYRIIMGIQSRIIKLLKSINLNMSFDIDIDASMWGEEIKQELESVGDKITEGVQSV